MSELLQIKDLHIRYETADGVVRAVNGANLTIKSGETLGLVGETGAGKTTVAKGVMQLIPSPPGVIDDGQILFNGTDLLKMPPEEMRSVRGKEISMIFQDPMSALNPVMTVGEQIAEVIRVHSNVDKAQAARQAEEMMEMVGIQRERSGEYPHQFSGGMKQRVVIAIALACNPQILIADEPTTALDVTIQAQVLEMMRGLKKQFSTAMILITHDLGEVADICDMVAIMYAGRIIEYGTLADIFDDFKHPYTEGLFGSLPNLQKRHEKLKPIKGLMPDPCSLPEGCYFHPRCKYATDACRKIRPERTYLSENHYVECLAYQEGSGVTLGEEASHE